MEYKCSLSPIDKLLISTSGIVEPLCNMCHSKDCSNPIEKKTMSIVGITKTYRLYRLAVNFMAVVSCDGFLPLLKLEEMDPSLDNGFVAGE